MYPDPPHTNGVMVLVTGFSTTLRDALLAIISTFVADSSNGAVNTQWIVTQYNNAHVGNEINGDTAESVLYGGA